MRSTREHWLERWTRREHLGHEGQAADQARQSLASDPLGPRAGDRP